MKVFLDIFRYLLSAVLALSIFIILICNTAISTVLSEGYVMSKMSQTNYYKKIYEDFNNNCLKYIMQSGFNESVLKDVCTIQKVEEDINYIVENVYSNRKHEIETESIKSNLQSNINNYLEENKLYVENNDAVNEFLNIICDEYINTIFHTSYEEKAHEYVLKCKNIVKELNKYAKYILIFSIIIIFLIDIKFPSRNISIAGMSLLLCGLILVYSKYVVMKNIDINHIFILNQPFSDMLRLIVNEFLEDFIGKAKIFNIVGIILIIVGNIMQYENNKKKTNKKTQLYLPYIK